MSLMDKLKSEAKRVREAAAERQAFFDDVRLFKPADGDNMIRILPHWNKKKREGDELFFVKREIHYLPKKKNDGTGKYNAPFACLTPYEIDCPACTAYTALRKAKDKSAKDIKPSERYLYNIIDYGSKENGPAICVYAMPQTVHVELMDWSEEINCEFWDLKKGRDWKLKKIVDKTKSSQFGTKYKLMPKPTDSAVPSKLLADVEEHITNLDDVWVEKDMEKMIEALDMAGIDVSLLSKSKKNRDDDEDEDEDEAPRKKKRVVDEDEDEDEVPRKKKRVVEEEDEEPEAPPRKKKRVVEEEDEDEAPPPRKKKVVEEDEDEAPRKKKKVVEEEEEDEAPPRKKKKAVEEEEEDEAPPRKKKKAAEDVDDPELDEELKRLGV